eukprot:gene22308-9600_t
MGADCQKVDYCFHETCSSHGTCMNSRTGYACDCDAGFIGANCQNVDYCYSQTCTLHRTCHNKNVNPMDEAFGPEAIHFSHHRNTTNSTGYTCECNAWYTGINCQIPYAVVVGGILGGVLFISIVIFALKKRSKSRRSAVYVPDRPLLPVNGRIGTTYETQEPIQEVYDNLPPARGPNSTRDNNPQSRPHFSQLAATLRQHADAIRSFERTYESVDAASAPPVSPAPIVDADSAPPVSSAPIASGTSHGAAGVRCRACHATVSGNETFCRTCGVELQLAVAAVLPATAPAARHCKACQAPIDPDAKFCRACGASLSAQSLKTAAASPFAQAATTATNSQGPSFPSKMTSPQTSLSRENWSSTGAGKQKLFPLGTGSAEYASVADCFSLTLPAKQIDRIERVENAALHEAFGVATVIIHKQIALRKHSPGASIQSLLFHGTSAVDMIVNSTDGNGFLPLLSGTSVGAIFGEGTYFARDAKYSDAYALCLETGQKQLLVVDVLVGLWTQGAKGMKICPLLPGEKYSRFNSLVDNPQDPAIFVVQHSNQAYP